jgi:hypothetical protein
VMETARWQREECGDNQPCMQALNALQEFCTRGGEEDVPGGDLNILEPAPGDG